MLIPNVVWVGEIFMGNCEVASTYAVCAAELCFGHGRQLPAFSQGPSVSSSYPARDMLVRRRTGEKKKKEEGKKKKDKSLPWKGASLSSKRHLCPPLRCSQSLFSFCPRTSEWLERPPCPEQNCQEEKGILGSPASND